MSNSPVLTFDDLERLIDANKMYLQYMIETGIRKDAPELYKKQHYTNIHLLDFYHFWKENRSIGDEIRIARPARTL